MKPACAILSNLTAPTIEEPSLLRHKEVSTIFHEFGHVMHCVLTKSQYSLFSWSWPIVPWLVVFSKINLTFLGLEV